MFGYYPGYRSGYYPPAAGGNSFTSYPLPSRARRGDAIYPEELAGYASPYERARQQELYDRQRLREQRAREERLRRQQLAAEEQRQQAEQARQQALRRLLLRRNTRAATVIQRAWRQYAAQQLRQRHDAAARVLVVALRRAAAVGRAKKIAASLRQLRAVGLRTDALYAQYERAPHGFRNSLAFADAVEKQILLVDGVQTYGQDLVRDQRKAVVAKAQRYLRLADFMLKTVLPRCAARLQRAVRDWRQRRHQAKRKHAAEIVRRTLVAAPKVRRARAAANTMRHLQTHRKLVAEARQAYIAALQAAVNVAEAEAGDDAFVRSQARMLADSWRQQLQVVGAAAGVQATAAAAAEALPVAAAAPEENSAPVHVEGSDDAADNADSKRPHLNPGADSGVSSGTASVEASAA